VKSIMTAHIAVNGEAATLDRAIVHDLLRVGLGFDGVILADALEMKGISARHDVADAAVLALEAGVDALIVGHDLGAADVDRIVRALERRVDPELLAAAAARVASLAGVARPQAIDVDRSAAREAARRAVHAEGNVSFPAPPRIVELRPVANIAAGEAGHTLGEAVVVREGEPIPEADVYVVRDVHRHPWMREADRAGAVVVEMGLPVWRPERARGYVAGYGGGRASLDAIAELLGEGVPA
jgi:beta-N-acetylhexosaminidase